ncbi:hypothetical protein D1007_46553 [Hordeum vulgare]|nr:hypothetical protein D1007_46553 [Hordeum vulgare]
MHADTQILEDTSSLRPPLTPRTRLATLNDISWSFLEGTAGAFDEDYKVFSQCARAYLRSIAVRLLPGQAHATHHYEEGTQDVEASPSSRFKEPIVLDISDDEE